MAVLHCLWLETGTAANLRQLLDSVVSITTDLGTEFGFVEIRPAPLLDVLPWVRGPIGDLNFDRQDEWALGEWHEALDPHEVLLDFQKSTALPGMMHILHNAANSIMSVVPSLKEKVDSLAVVARLVNEHASCSRLCQTCFAGPIGHVYHARLREFSAHVYEARWGSIAWGVQSLLAIEAILKWGWDKDTYLAAGNDRLPQGVGTCYSLTGTAFSMGSRSGFFSSSPIRCCCTSTASPSSSDAEGEWAARSLSELSAVWHAGCGCAWTSSKLNIQSSASLLHLVSSSCPTAARPSSPRTE